MAKRNYKAKEITNKHIREIAPINFPGSKTFDIYEGFEADVDYWYGRYCEDVDAGVNDPDVGIVEFIAGKIEKEHPTENPIQFNSLMKWVRATLPKVEKSWSVNIKEGKEQMKESEISSSYVKQLKKDRRYYERTADGHWEAEDWTVANEYYARANFLSLLEKYYVAKLNNDTEGKLKAAETLYKVYTDPEFLVENFYIKKDKEEDKRIYQRAIKPGFLGELKNWNEDDTLVEGIYPDAYDNFVSETLPEIKELLDKGHLKESKLSEVKESANYWLTQYQDEYCESISYNCFTLDGDGDQVDLFAIESTYKDAVETCKSKSNKTGIATQVVILIDQNGDDVEEGWDFLDKVECGSHEVVYTYSPKLTESKLSDLADKAKEDIREYILMCKDREDKFSGKKSFELSNKFLIENLSNTYMLPENFLEELFNKVESELIDEGNSFWWKSEVWQESKTQNRKQRIKEDSWEDPFNTTWYRDAPKTDPYEKYTPEQMDIAERYWDSTFYVMKETLGQVLYDLGFEEAKGYSPYKAHEYVIFAGSGPRRNKKFLALPGSYIRLRVDIGKYGIKNKEGEKFECRKLAEKVVELVKDYEPDMNLKITMAEPRNQFHEYYEWEFELKVPEDLFNENSKIAESKSQKVKAIGKLLNEASERSDCEQAFFDWFESQAPHYDVSNYDAFEAGARAKGVEVQEENYMMWLEQFAPHYDVSGYDAFEAGWNLA